ncbi:MAG: sigma-B regulation protein RsbU (phosphoserine phosphatase) [Arenicella sp.]|jgi:sigma-B regulation protein RsbU (phosphoserine phosphatase)
MPLSTENLLQLRELELKDLLETIRAINSNTSEDNLYRIFKFIMSSSQRRSKMALYVLGDYWECEVAYGCNHAENEIKLSEEVLKIKEISDIPASENFSEFDKVVPIVHKNKSLAYVFLGFAERTEVEDLELEFVEALGNIILVAIENKKLARKEVEQQSYKIQLNIAQEVQSLLFPKELPNTEKLRIESSYLPHHRIGGDYYDYLELSESQFIICVADVSGKGIPAAILMSNFQAGLRILAKQKLSLDEIVHKLNELIMLNSQGANFITAFFFTYDSESKKIQYVNAGHNPPFFINSVGEMSRLETGTTIVGGFDELPFLEIGEIENAEDFFLFAFTDGFIETYNEENEEFGEDTFEAFLNKNYKEDQKKIHKDLLSLLKNFKGQNEYVDDITLLSCKVSS